MAQCNIIRWLRLGLVRLWTPILLVLLASPSVSLAQGGTISPDAIKVSTPTYRVTLDKFKPRLGTYTYGVSWQGIPAASAKFTVSKEDNRYHLIADARSAKAIDLFYTLRYRADGFVSAVDLLPDRATIRHQEGSRIKNIDLSFTSGGEVFSVRTQNDGKPAEMLRFTPENQMLDPFSAGMIARSLDWKAGDVYQFDAFNGRSRYLITLSHVGFDKVWLNGKNYDCFVVSPTVRKLTEVQNSNKLRQAKIYVTNDDRRDILKIVSEVFIGSVVTELESFEPIQAPASDAVIAKVGVGNSSSEVLFR